MVKPAVQAVLSGFNATVFAYGQTGTGKTYTMQGEDKDKEKMGMAPRAVYEIFEKFGSKIQENKDQEAYSGSEDSEDEEAPGDMVRKDSTTDRAAK